MLWGLASGSVRGGELRNLRISWVTGIKTCGARGFMIVRNTEISCTEILYIIRTDQEGDS